MTPATIIVAGIVAILFVTILIREIKNRRNGKGCSCGCSGCAMSETCHKNKEQKKETL